MIAINGQAIIPIVNQRGYVIGENGIDLDRDLDAALYFPGYPYTGSTINDRAGSSPANNGTILGATWTRLSSGLWVLDFDGTDDIITVTDAASIQNIFAVGGSVKAWINPDSDGEADTGRIYSKSGTRFQVLEEAGGYTKLRFYTGFSVADPYWTTTAAVVPINTYSHLILTYNNSNIANDPIIYLNGVAQAITEGRAPNGTAATDAGGDLIIGNVAGGTETFDGEIGLFSYLPVIWGVSDALNNYNQERHLFGV